MLQFYEVSRCPCWFTSKGRFIEGFNWGLTLGGKSSDKECHYKPATIYLRWLNRFNYIVMAKWCFPHFELIYGNCFSDPSIDRIYHKFWKKNITRNTMQRNKKEIWPYISLAWMGDNFISSGSKTSILTKNILFWLYFLLDDIFVSHRL